MTRSPFFYVGDKYKLTSQFNEIFPKNINRLIEPFCGGGSVFLNIKANSYLANDNNSWMIKLHKFLQKHANRENYFINKIERLIREYGFSASVLGICVDPSLKKKYPKTHYAVFNKNAYNKLKEDFNEDQTDLYKLYLLLVFGFNHMLRFNRSGVFNLPVGDVDYNKNVKEALKAYFAFCRENTILFECKDFETFINRINFGNNDFVYLDPPYLISSSEYNKDWEKMRKEDYFH